MRCYHDEKFSLRRYRLYGSGDSYKLVIFVIFSLTFIRPLIDSARGFIKIHDMAWFLHPLICFGTFLAYALAVIEGVIFKGRNA